MRVNGSSARTITVRLLAVVAAVLLLAPSATGNVVLNTSSQVDVNVSFDRIASFNASGLDLQDNTVFNFFDSACSEGEAVTDVNGDGTLECVSIAGQTGDLYVNETGDNMTGQLNMTGHAINGIAGLTTDGDIGITGGNVGVGTESPSTDLDVDSNLRVRGLTNCDSVDTDSEGNLVCGEDATGSDTGGGWNDTGTLIELLTSTDDVNATSLYVDNTNNRVGVGTSSPGVAFEVASGSVSLPGGVISNSELANSDVTVSAGNQLSGGGSVSLGGSTTLDVDEGPGSGLDADQVDGHEGSAFLELDGTDSMNGTLDAGDNTVTGVADPSANSDAVNQGWADSEYLNRDGSDSMAGQLDMAGNDVVNIGNMTLNGAGGITGFNLGVGTSNPAHQLDVNGNLRVQSNLVGADIVNTNNINTDAVTDSELASNAVTASGGELDSSVAGSGLDYNGGQLDVTDADTLDGHDASDFLELDGSDSMNGSLDLGGNNVALNGGWVSNDGQNEGIAVDNDGNVGIGTASAGSLLTVAGDAQVQGDLDVFGNITNTDVNNLNVNGSLLPPAGYDNTFDLGSGSRRWRDAYIAGSLYDASGNAFFDGGCGDNAHVTGISSDGSINCGSDSGDISAVSGGTAISVSGGDSGEATVNVAGNSIDDAEIVDDGLDSTSIGAGAIGGSELSNSGIVNETHIVSGAVTAGGNELDSSVAGSGLDYNNGALDVTSVNGFDGSEFLELDGSDSMNGSLDVGGNDLVDGATVVWDASNSFVPQDRLENDALTVTAGNQLSGGGSVSLGGSTTLDVDEGPGSGLDADQVDGHEGSAFLELDGTDSMNGTLDAGNNQITNIGSGGTNFESDGDLDMNGQNIKSASEICIGNECSG